MRTAQQGREGDIAPRCQGKNNVYGLTKQGEEEARVVKALIG